MTKGLSVDRVALHRRLWADTDRFGKTEIYQIALAKELDVTKPTMSLIIKDLVTDGRIRKVAARKRNIGIYIVRDPALFDHPFVPVPVPGIGVDRCEICGDLERVGKHLMQIK